MPAFASAQVLAPAPAPVAPAPATGPGFGDTDAFAFTVEEILGFQNQEFGEEDEPLNLDDRGMQPTFRGDLGFHSIDASGLTLGGAIGLEVIFLDSPGSGDDDGSLTIIRIRPRIGYAGSKSPYLGFWIRGGPSIFHIGADFGEGSTQNTNTLAASFEVYGVITPFPSLAILLGPNADFNLWGKTEHDRDAAVSTVGASIGIAVIP